MKISQTIVCLITGIIALPWVGASAQAPAGFTVQLMSTFDYPGTGNLTRPQKINDHGDVVGEYADSTGVIRGFTMTSNGKFSKPLVDPNDTAGSTETRGINNSGLVCGHYLDSVAYNGFFLTGKTFTTYDVAGASTTILLGLNNAGDFAGSAIPTGGIQEAFVSIGGTVTEFAVTNATTTLAYQLNDSDQSCGYYADASAVNHGFYRDANGTIHAPVDLTGSTGTILFGNNNANIIVGRYSDGAGATHGIVFVPPRKFIVYDYPGSTFTSLNGINTANEICGRYLDSAGIEHGLLAKLVRGSVDGNTRELPLAASGSTVVRSLEVREADVAPAY